MSESSLTVQELADQLESLIDRSSLATVLEALSQVCGEKADHLRSNWQDRTTAKSWDKAGHAIDRIIPNLSV
jgi:hypothetical protein